MKYLHTMVRVSNLEASLAFYCDKLGLEEVGRSENANGRFTLVFLAAPGDKSAQVELTYNWDPEQLRGGRNFGHLAYAVDDIYATCQRLLDAGVRHQSAARATGAWHSFDRPTMCRSNCFNVERRWHQNHRGRKCRIPASGSESREVRYNARPTNTLTRGASQ